MNKSSFLLSAALVLFFVTSTSEASGNNKEDDVEVYISLDLYELKLNIGQDAYGKYGKRIVPEYYTGISISAGIRPFKYFGFEATYLQNDNNYEEGGGILGYNITGRSSGEFNLFTAKAIVFVPVPFTESFEFFGSLGAGRVKYSLDIKIDYETPKNKSGELAQYKKKGKVYGAPLSFGLEYHPKNSHFSARVEYTLFTRHVTKITNIDESSDMMSIGLKYSF